jgi:hypothetical protein
VRSLGPLEGLRKRSWRWLDLRSATPRFLAENGGVPHPMYGRNNLAPHSAVMQGATWPG